VVILPFRSSILRTWVTVEREISAANIEEQFRSRERNVAHEMLGTHGNAELLLFGIGSPNWHPDRHLGRSFGQQNIAFRADVKLTVDAYDSGKLRP
jgi:hypothetical protein